VANSINRISPQTQPAATNDDPNAYHLENNNLFGYEFYTAKIDSSGNITLSSEQKQSIANLLKYLNFPTKLTKTLAILIVDPTVVKPTDHLNIPWANGSATMQLQAQAGSQQGVAGGAVIVLNNLSGIDLATLTHELGHVIGGQLTNEEWNQYYKLRGIPSGTQRYSTNWNQSPNEDFAEVYKNTYRPNNSAEWNVKTEYGTLAATSDFLEASTPCAYKQGAELQSCRVQNRNANFYGTPVYVVQVSEATKQFVKDVVAKLRR